jgi:sugar lactone lactonase YvrE
VYVVHHGFRESVEVFEIDTKPNPPTFTWIGCAVAPETVSMNSISPVPDGGFVVTNIVRRNLTNVQELMRTGGNTGELWEWHPGEGWKMVPDSEAPTPNGIEVSRDGRWYYVNLWAAGKVMRMSRGQSPVKKDFVQVDFHPDNIRWQTDGSLYTAGQGGPTSQRIAECLNRFCPDATTNVARIDPQTLSVRQIIRDSNKEHFISSTTGLQVGKEIWLGTSHSDRIARYPAP